MVKGYREQKKLDREEDLVKRRQLEYERYLTAFGNAGRWKGVDDKIHAEAEAEYHEAHSNLLLVGSDEAIMAANEFHRYYVDSDIVDPKEAKTRYARMIVAMRKDGFEESSLSVREIAMIQATDTGVGRVSSRIELGNDCRNWQTNGWLVQRDTRRSVDDEGLLRGVKAT